MKQFNLKEYLANPSRKVVTRDGRSARIICTDRKSDLMYNVVALVKFSEFENEGVYCYSDNGKYLSGRDGNDLDLFFAPEKHEGWVNMYKLNCREQNLGCVIYKTEEDAIGAGRTSNELYIRTIKIEWEE